MQQSQGQNAALRRMEGADTVIIVGGHGGMSANYREVVERRGWRMRHFERRIPAGARRKLRNVALVIVVASMVSHALRQQITDSVGRDVKIIYLRTASVSTLRDAMAKTVTSPEATSSC